MMSYTNAPSRKSASDVQAMIEQLCTDPIGAGAAFFIGLLGSAHCLVMCGGITAAFSLSVPENDRQGARFWTLITSASAGRVFSYTTLGVLFGMLGGWLRGDHETFVVVFRLFAGLILIAMGLWISNWWRGIQSIEQLGERFISPIVRTLRSKASPDSIQHAFQYGLAWGFLPCGLVYSALLWSASTAHAGQAGIQMFLFGLGTLPAILGAGYLSAHVSFALKSNLFRQFSGALVMLYGVWTIAPLVWMI